MKNITKGLLVFSFLALLVAGSPASANNNSGDKSEKGYLSARAGLKADALVKLESTTAVALGPNGTLRVLGAKVVSASESSVNAEVTFGQSVVKFVVKIDEDTKINGSGSVDADDLKAGDKISFSGTITSSTSSAITVDGDHVVSRALIGASQDNATSWSGEIKAVNESDNSLSIDLKNGRTVKVVVSSSTAITLDGATSSLASLDEGDKVKIGGSLSADGSVITATKISAQSEDSDDSDEDDEDEDEDKDKGGKSDNGRGWFWKFRNWFGR